MSSSVHNGTGTGTDVTGPNSDNTTPVYAIWRRATFCDVHTPQ